ncbi:MAG: ABC transporter permease [Nocardioidaceae bacterium]|nr:ABC transporter permease [Nocardioidaceae bacterium]
MSEEKTTEQPAAPRGAQWLPDVTTTLLAIVMAMIVGAILIVATSGPDDLWSSYHALFKGGFGGFNAIGGTLVRSAPLICAALGVTLAFRAGLFNIGAQGQIAAGALCAIYVAFHFDLPGLIHVPFVLLAGAAGGALFGLVPGFLKARTGAHEVITTIMLNNIATRALVPFVLGLAAFQRPGSNELLTPVPQDSARFWTAGNTHAGVVIMLLVALGVWWLIERSRLGFELRAVGANPDAARTAGMSVARVTMIAMASAGALAGLAATMNIMGKGEPISDTAFGSIGFDAITVALLGRATPLGTVLAGILFAGLSEGGSQMQIDVGTPSQLANVIQALIVLFVAAPTLVRGLARLKDKNAGSSATLAKGWGA